MPNECEHDWQENGAFHACLEGPKKYWMSGRRCRKCGYASCCGSTGHVAMTDEEAAKYLATLMESINA